jgi:hypothetical protein
MNLRIEVLLRARRIDRVNLRRSRCRIMLVGFIDLKNSCFESDARWDCDWATNIFSKEAKKNMASNPEDAKWMKSTEQGAATQSSWL